jgi:hypothetical protein
MTAQLLITYMSCTSGCSEILATAMALESGHLISDAVVRLVHAAAQLQIPEQLTPPKLLQPLQVVLGCTGCVTNVTLHAMRTARFCALALCALHSLHAQNTCSKHERYDKWPAKIIESAAA